MREQGLQVFRELLPGADTTLRDGMFGDELLEIGIDNVFGRPGDATATDELTFHFQIARNNGLTEDEIAEVIYHASGYAGLPCRQHRLQDRPRGV